MVLPFFEMAKLYSSYSPLPIRNLSNQLRFCWCWLEDITHLVQLPWPDVFHLQVVPQIIVQEHVLCLEKKKRHNSLEHAHYIIKRIGPHCRKYIFCASNAPNILGVLVKAILYGVTRYSNRPPSTWLSLMQKLLVKDEPDVIFQLCEEVTNLFGKLRWPSDERLLVYHTSFLSAFGISCMFKWLYQVFYKVIPHSAMCSPDGKEMCKLNLALKAMAYTDSRITIEDIIKMHGLLDHIDNCWQNVGQRSRVFSTRQ